MTARIGVDTGGTFTDLVAEVDGALRLAKVPSTRADPGSAVLAGLRALGLAGVPVVHGTTVATNALLERRGARVLFVTTEGFEDLVVIGRQDRPALYDPAPTRPPPLHVATFGVGAVPDLDALERAVEDAAAECVAICLLDAYRDDTLEERVAAPLRALGLPVSSSSRVLPEIREFERASTTLADAFVRPVVGRYLADLGAALAPAPLDVMLSNAGTASAARAAAVPVRTVLSGPAGGVRGAWDAAVRAGLPAVLSFDMGGTSTDVSLLEGTPTLTTDTTIGGVPIAVPAIEVLTVGAGGGSVASVDSGGALRVGPESAGADPGPACYGRGGDLATVTDAHRVLGHLGDALGPGVRLDLAAAHRAVGHVAALLGTSVPAAAAAILDVADAAMERPLRRLTVERGRDPGQFALVAFGGAGGLHAARLAASLRLHQVLLPAHAGLLSAFGMLSAPRRAERGRTVLERLSRGTNAVLPSHVHEVAVALTREAREELLSEGEVTRLVLTADVRFVGQSYELAVPLGDDLVAGFLREHQRRYGFVLDRDVEVVTVRAVAEGDRPPLTLPPLAAGDADPAAAESGRRETSLARETPVYARERLHAGAVVHGPAVVEEMSATSLVPTGWAARVLPAGDLLLEKTGGY